MADTLGRNITTLGRTYNYQPGVTAGTGTPKGNRKPQDYMSGQLNGPLVSRAIIPDSMTPGAGGVTHSMGGGNENKGKVTSLPPGSPPAGGSPYGSQSGPGILESWFNQRASGTDPAFNYAAERGMETLGNRSAAAGNFNSGAARQQESDFYANLVAQRMGQLDQLAAGASGEHIGRLGLMFNQGLGLAGGQAGQASAYDLGAAGNMAAANQAQQQMFLNKAGIDSQGNQAAFGNIASLYGLGAARGGNNRGGQSNPYGY